MFMILLSVTFFRNKNVPCGRCGTPHTTVISRPAHDRVIDISTAVGMARVPQKVGVGKHPRREFCPKTASFGIGTLLIRGTFESLEEDKKKKTLQTGVIYTPPYAVIVTFFRFFFLFFVFKILSAISVKAFTPISMFFSPPSLTGASIVPVCMRQATTPARYIAAAGNTPHTATLVEPICAERFHRHYNMPTAGVPRWLVSLSSCLLKSIS